MEVKLPMIADDMNLYMEPPKDSMKILWELIREFTEQQDTKSVNINPRPLCIQTAPRLRKNF